MNWIKKELNTLSEHQQLRDLSVYDNAGAIVTIGKRNYYNFSSNDYLNLSIRRNVVEKSQLYLDKYGTGSTSSRLITGTLSCHEELEKSIAQLKGYESALVFGSGYLANCGVITSIVGRHDTVFADKLIHASIIDAVKLSGATLVRFKHNDTSDLQNILVKHCNTGKKLIITESVFSMDGDIAPLVKLCDIAEAFSAMIMVDEAHATGVFGKNGAGLVASNGLNQRVTIAMGTFSKAIGSYGGYICCDSYLRKYLINKARAFIYTTSLPPAVIGASLGAIETLMQNHNMGKTLLLKANIFREKLHAAGLNTGKSASQIIPVMVGNGKKTVSLSTRLREDGIIAVAIRPPTVPKNGERLRISLSLAHTDIIIKKIADRIIDAAHIEGIL